MDATVSDNTIKGNDDYYDDWTTGNWCLEGRSHSATTIAGRSAAAATTSVTVSTSTRNKRKLKQSRKNHKKKPRTINQNNKNKNNNNTNLDEDDKSDELHDYGNDDDDDDDDHDDDDDYSDVYCDDSNDDESEPDKSSGKGAVVAETSMHNGGAIVRNKYQELWNKMYGRLLKYKKKFQSMSVPYEFDDNEDGCHLGRWVCTQRQKYKNKSLPAEMIDRLTSIDFVWDPYDAKWLKMYQRLVAYKEQYKSTCVPKSYKADPQLVRWVVKQRTNYNTNNSRLTTERKHQLNSIGFVWDPYDTLWTEMYERLVVYKNQYKNTRVSQRYQADPQLAHWVSAQRTNYNRNRSRLTTNRVKRLNSIGFIWNAEK